MRPQGEPSEALNLHASCVALQNCGLLILGPSGSGKSGLALQLMALGAALVADDRTMVFMQDGALWAKAPPGLPPMIEARGVGLLPVPGLHSTVRLTLAVDMGRLETARLPPHRAYPALGFALPLVFHSPAAHFPSAILHYMRHGRHS